MTNNPLLCDCQARRQHGGNAPPDFRFCPPPDFFLAPLGIFWERSWCFWAEKTLKFAISAGKSFRISAKTFFFLRSPAFGRKICDFDEKKLFGDHLILVGKFVISARKSLRISSETFAPLILILPPPIS